MVSAEKMSTMIAYIDLGKSAKDCPAVKTAEDKQVYAELEAEAKAIEAKGGTLEIPQGWI